MPFICQLWDTIYIWYQQSSHRKANQDSLGLPDWPGICLSIIAYLQLLMLGLLVGPYIQFQGVLTDLLGGPDQSYSSPKKLFYREFSSRIPELEKACQPVRYLHQECPPNEHNLNRAELWSWECRLIISWVRTASGEDSVHQRSIACLTPKTAFIYFWELRQRLLIWGSVLRTLLQNIGFPMRTWLGQPM